LCEFRVSILHGVKFKKKFKRNLKKGRANIPWKLLKEEEKKRHCSWVQCALTIDQCALLLQGKMSVTSNITHV